MKVTKDQVLAAIKGETFSVLPNGRTTVCQLTLQNGFTVEGSSSCVDPLEFNAELGKQIARQKAEDEVWKILGYELATLLSEQSPLLVPEVKGAMKQHMHVQTYVGTKVIHATPMTRGFYNGLRGWTVPENEDPRDEGFMVEYTDGGAPNVSGYAGYISWSPKDVFEKAYRPVVAQPLTYLDRLKIEERELLDRLMKLRAFIISENFTKLGAKAQSDLKEQEMYMGNYHWVLTRRLKG
jgi:Phage protein (N4 Gp49/phage Sf6 gene 66) family